LKEKFKNRVDSWELVDRKARQWIQTNFGQKTEEIFAAAEEFLKS